MDEFESARFEGRVGKVVGRRGKAQKGGRIVDIAYNLGEAPSDQHGCVEGRASSLELRKMSVNER